MTFFVMTIDDISGQCWGGQVEAASIPRAMDKGFDGLRKQIGNTVVSPQIRTIGVVEMPRSPGADSFAAFLLIAMGSRHAEIIANRRAGG